MSDYSNPLLYLNLSGEMLYVLRQRLKAQKIETQKTVQVLDDITAAILNPTNLSAVFEKSSTFNLSWFRTTLEAAALSTIMKLDQDSMNKLFDLMTMVVKYQLIAATGPREVILITLNHIDAFREMVTRTAAHERITLVHRMVVELYGDMTYEVIWKTREACLQELSSSNIRVSMLLKLGLQNEDTSFNISPQIYNEKYNERRSELAGLKLFDNSNRKNSVGSLKLFGERITILGRDIYSSNYGRLSKPKVGQKRENSFKDPGTKAELGMLAKQLGTEDPSEVSQSFSLDLFDDEVDTKLQREKPDEKEDCEKPEDELKSSDEYRKNLGNICSDFIEDEVVQRKVNLLQLLDEVDQ